MYHRDSIATDQNLVSQKQAVRQVYVSIPESSLFNKNTAFDMLGSNLLVVVMCESGSPHLGSALLTEGATDAPTGTFRYRRLALLPLSKSLEKVGVKDKNVQCVTVHASTVKHHYECLL